MPSKPLPIPFNSSAPLAFLRLPDVIARTGLRRDSIYRLAREGRFPKPARLSTFASGWVQSEVDDWIREKISARDSSKRKGSAA
jgi:prophage regulatory protein